MVKDVEELRREIEQFEDNMKRTNGMIDLLDNGVELLNRNYEELRVLSKTVQETNSSFAHTADLLRMELESEKKELYNKSDQYASDIKKEIISQFEFLNKAIEVYHQRIITETKNEAEQIKQKLESVESSLSVKIKNVTTFAIISCVIAAVSLIVAFVI